MLQGVQVTCVHRAAAGWTDVSECHAVSSWPALPGPPPPPLYCGDVATVPATSSPAQHPPHCRTKFPEIPGNKENFVTIGAMPAAPKQSSSAQHIRILCPDTAVFLVVIGDIVCTAPVLCIPIMPLLYTVMLMTYCVCSTHVTGPVP